MLDPGSPPVVDRIPPVTDLRKSRLAAPAPPTAAADPAPAAAKPDPANPWQFDHWPRQQPWQESPAGANRLAQPGFGAPIDPQNWENPDHMTWADYKKPPGTNWADPAKSGSV